MSKAEVQPAQHAVLASPTPNTDPPTFCIEIDQLGSYKCKRLSCLRAARKRTLVRVAHFQHFWAKKKKKAN